MDGVLVCIHPGACHLARSTPIRRQDHSLVAQAPFSLADLEQCSRCRVLASVRRRTGTNGRSGILHQCYRSGRHGSYARKRASARDSSSEKSLIPKSFSHLNPDCLSGRIEPPSWSWKLQAASNVVLPEVSTRQIQVTWGSHIRVRIWKDSEWPRKKARAAMAGAPTGGSSVLLDSSVDGSYM